MQNALKLEIKRLSVRAFEKIKKVKELEDQYRKKFAKRTGLESDQPEESKKNMWIGILTPHIVPAMPIFSPKQSGIKFCKRLIRLSPQFATISLSQTDQNER